MKLNLGSGQNLMPGYVNVDKFGQPDEKVDLEQFPWPWWDQTVDEVVMNHSLEHMGRDPDVFCGIVRELYRVCKPDAIVHIAVPHPRHDHFLGDPTHVRVITPEVLSLFSKKNCEQWRQQRAANSPLALYYDVDFEVVNVTVTLDPVWRERLNDGTVSALEIDLAMRERNNVVSEYRIQWRCVKEVAR